MIFFIYNTWFEQKLKSRSTWKHPNGKDENQIDYILVDKRYRNSITNYKTNYGSDHDPVWMSIKVKLKKQKRKHVHKRWNLDRLKNEDMQNKFTKEFSKELKKINDKQEWDKMKACLTTVAENWYVENITWLRSKLGWLKIS